MNIGRTKHQIGVGWPARNSSIELLRILSMFLILAHHFLVHNAYDYTTLPFGVPRFLLQLFLESGGKVGVVIFFTISAWHLLEREQTLRGCLRRAWNLEKEVLFYGLALAAFFFLFFRSHIGARYLLKSLMPLTQQVWWYPTAYATFLLLLPFLVRGLRALGRRAHLALCMVLLALYGVLTLVPGTQMVTQVWSLVYLFVLIAGYRWYVEGAHDLRPAPMVAVGMVILAACALLSMGAWALAGVQLGAKYGNLVTSEIRLPVLLVGFGVFLLFQRRTFYSKAINGVARGAFAVYLITEYPPAREVLWRGALDLGSLSAEPWGLAVALGLLLALYLGCTALDLVRRRVFRATVDPLWDRLFGVLYGKALIAADALMRRLEG